MYIVGKISDKSKVEQSGSYSSGNPPDSTILANIIANYGGVESDYSIAPIGSDDEIRIQNGDSYTLVWSGDILTGVSFSVEDAKLWLRFSSSKTSIMMDGKESFILSVDVLLADKSAIDTTFSGSLDIPLIAPNGANKARFYFTSGKASKQISSSAPGIFMSPTRFSGYKIDNSVTIEVLL